MTAGGTAGIDWGNIENATTAVDLSGTDIQLCDTVTTLTGHTAQTGDSFVRLGAPAGASVSADIAAIEAQTDDIGVAGAGLTEAGGTGDHLTAVPWNSDWDAEVQSEVNDALVVLGLDHLVGAAVVGADVTDNSIFARLVSASATADWDDFVNTTDSLQALRDRGDAAWITATTVDLNADQSGVTIGTVSTLTGHTAQTGDNFARLGAPAGASVSADIATVDTVVDAILAMLDDPRAEPGQGAPAVNADMATKVDYLYKWTRNQKDNDGSTTQFYDDAGTTVDHKQTTSEAAGTVTKGEIVSGP